MGGALYFYLKVCLTFFTSVKRKKSLPILSAYLGSVLICLLKLWCQRVRITPKLILDGKLSQSLSLNIPKLWEPESELPMVNV